MAAFSSLDWWIDGFYFHKSFGFALSQQTLQILQSSIHQLWRLHTHRKHTETYLQTHLQWNLQFYLFLSLWYRPRLLPFLHCRVFWCMGVSFLVCVCSGGNFPWGSQMQGLTEDQCSAVAVRRWSIRQVFMAIQMRDVVSHWMLRHN